jgi:hypothetical protein
MRKSRNSSAKAIDDFIITNERSRDEKNVTGAAIDIKDFAWITIQCD